MEAAVTHVVQGGVHGIKLQLLHILKDTDLADYYATAPVSEFACMTLPAYVDTVCTLLTHIPDTTVIYRLTGDGPKKLLIAPLWSGDKKTVRNTLEKEIERRFPCNRKC